MVVIFMFSVLTNPSRHVFASFWVKISKKINKIDMIDELIDNSQREVACDFRRPMLDLHAKFGSDRLTLRDFHSLHTYTYTYKHSLSYTQTRRHIPLRSCVLVPRPFHTDEDNYCW
ncbi:hypothetical protein Y032_0018g3735 [Ancylostoma ceylanicum]|uniref:Uncharacterized protein n=1 Tax=Ancylostoma ceylanicum TaxID=53326 RepID=A0A016V3A5_9BILA|nr:hypothetical protein Y032_0018g3735 [Ancylostoma ceylanicum]